MKKLLLRRAVGVLVLALVTSCRPAEDEPVPDAAAEDAAGSDMTQQPVGVDCPPQSEFPRRASAPPHTTSQNGGTIETNYARMVYPAGAYGDGERVVMHPAAKHGMGLSNPPDDSVDVYLVLGKCEEGPPPYQLIFANSTYEADTVDGWAHARVLIHTAIDTTTVVRDGFVILSN